MIQKKLLFIVLLLCCISFGAKGQNAEYKFYFGMCDYHGFYDSTKYSAEQIENAFRLTDAFFIHLENSPFVFKPEDIERIDVESLDKEFEQKAQKLQKMDTPPQPYWDSLKTALYFEMEAFYHLSKVASMAYKNPKELEKLRYEDECINRHKKALILGGDSLLKDWYELIKERVPNNCCPDKVWAEYEEQYRSENRLTYALVYVTTLGWWNCAVDHVPLHEKSFDYEVKVNNFLSLFVKVEEDCDF